MNREESLALYAQGRDAWNEWAGEMLRQRQALADSGVWPMGESAPDVDEVMKWRVAAKADFSGHGFDDETDFSGFVFPGPAEFQGAKFERVAKFDEATFEDDAGFDAIFESDAWFYSTMFKLEAWFNDATFKSNAWFHGATFEGNVRFYEARFEGDAWFYEARYEGVVWFDKATFEDGARFGGATFEGDARFPNARFAGAAGFDEARFEGEARFVESCFNGVTSFENAAFLRASDFTALQARSAFDLADAIFLEVPDLNQANFVKAPRLNNLRIEHSRGWVRDNFHGDRELEKRWQALRQIAIQAHDHDQEQIFFKEEIKARRGVIDKPWHGAYLAGWLYQIFADFGRSILRPFGLWLAHFPLFAAFYLWRSPALGGCVSGDGDPVASAFNLALRNGLLFASGVFSEKLPQTYACLYGVGEVAERTVPLVSGWTTALGALQVVVSAVLIFLILLALRNRFRIR